MQFHQGQRLRNLIEKKKIEQKQISELTGIPKSSLTEILKREEIMLSKLQKILKVLDVTQEDFFNTNYKADSEPPRKNINQLIEENEILRRENNQLLKDKIALQADIIELQKGVKKTRIVA